MNIFKGAFTALITPMNADGSVDFDGFRKNVKYQLEQGIDGLVPLGTTAETPTLDEKPGSEEDKIISIVLEEVRAFEKTSGKKIPVILGAGSNNTRDAVAYCERAKAAGADAALVVTPYYNKPTQEGLYQHYVSVADASPLPVVLYNVPGRTGVNLSAATTIRIAEDCPNVVAIKEASGILPQIDAIIAGAPDGFEVISGDDGLTYSLLGLGASGLISVIANAFPTEMAQLVHDTLDGNVDTALDTHRRFANLFRLSFIDGNPAGVKAMLAQREQCANVLRLPLVPVSEATEASIVEAFASF